MHPSREVGRFQMDKLSSRPGDFGRSAAVMINPYEPTIDLHPGGWTRSERKLRFTGWLYAYPSLALILFGIFATSPDHFAIPILVTGFSFAVPLVVLPSSNFLCWVMGAFLGAIVALVPNEAAPFLGLTYADRLAAILGVISATAISTELTYVPRFLLGLVSALVTILIIATPALALPWCLLGILLNHRAIRTMADNQKIHRSSVGGSISYEDSTDGTSVDF